MFKIDYSIVKTEHDLLSWARSTFELKKWNKPLINNSEERTVICQIWDKLAKTNTKEIKILESYPRHMSSKIREIMEGSEDRYGWKYILGIHLYREHLIHVQFSQDQDTKGKRPLANK